VLKLNTKKSLGDKYRGYGDPSSRFGGLSGKDKFSASDFRRTMLDVLLNRVNVPVPGQSHNRRVVVYNKFALLNKAPEPVCVVDLAFRTVQ